MCKIPVHHLFKLILASPPVCVCIHVHVGDWMQAKLRIENPFIKERNLMCLSVVVVSASDSRL